MAVKAQKKDYDQKGPNKKQVWILSIPVLFYF